MGTHPSHVSDGDGVLMGPQDANHSARTTVEGLDFMPGAERDACQQSSKRLLAIDAVDAGRASIREVANGHEATGFDTQSMMSTSPASIHVAGHVASQHNARVRAE